ncbi:hypothetical protein ACP70R_025295 [Stipagrostis hirtigluma subsp. patula]
MTRCTATSLLVLALASAAAVAVVVLSHQHAAVMSSSSLAHHGAEPAGANDAETAGSTGKEEALPGRGADGGGGGDDDGVVASQRRTAGAVFQLPELIGAAAPRWKPAARRLLLADGVGGTGTDSAARPSCGSNNPRIGCTPPSPH